MQRTVLASMLSIVLFAVSFVHAAPGKGKGNGDDGANSIFVAFESDLGNIEAGETVNLSWASSGARSCVASGGWEGRQDLFGSYTSPPLTDHSEFILTCKDRGLSESRSVLVAVTAPESPPEPDPVPPAPEPEPTPEPAPEPPPPEPEPTPEPPPPEPEPEPTPEPPPPEPEPALPPTVSFSVIPMEVDVGGDVTLIWTSTDADMCSATGDWGGEHDVSGEFVISGVTTHQTYSLSCEGPGGTAVALATVTAMGTVQLEWQAPSENVDGTPIAGLSEYRVSFGQNSGEYMDEVMVDGSVSSYPLRAPVGQHYVAMTAIDVNGAESGLSNEVLEVAE